MKNPRSTFLTVATLLGSFSTYGMSYFSNLYSLATQKLSPLTAPAVMHGASVASMASAALAHSRGYNTIALLCGVSSLATQYIAHTIEDSNARLTLHAITPHVYTQRPEQPTSHTMDTSSPAYKRLNTTMGHIAPNLSTTTHATQPMQSAPLASEGAKKTLKQYGTPSVHSTTKQEVISDTHTQLLTWYKKYLRNEPVNFSLIIGNRHDFFWKIEYALKDLQRTSPQQYQEFQQLMDQQTQDLCTQIEQDYQTMSPAKISEKYDRHSLSNDWSIYNCLCPSQQDRITEFMNKKNETILQQTIATIEDELLQGIALSAIANKYYALYYHFQHTERDKLKAYLDTRVLDWYEKYLRKEIADLSFISNNWPRDFFYKIEIALTDLQKKSPEKYQQFKRLMDQQVQDICTQIEQDYQILTPKEVTNTYDTRDYSTTWSSYTCICPQQQTIIEKFINEKNKAILQEKIAYINRALQDTASLTCTTVQKAVEMYQQQLWTTYDKFFPMREWLQLNDYLKKELPQKEMSRRIDTLLTWLTQYSNGVATIQTCPFKKDGLSETLHAIKTNHMQQINPKTLRDRIISNCKQLLADISTQEKIYTEQKFTLNPLNETLSLLGMEFLSLEDLQHLEDIYLQYIAASITKKYQHVLEWCQNYSTGKSTLSDCPASPTELQDALKNLFPHTTAQTTFIKNFSTHIMHDIQQYISKTPAKVAEKELLGEGTLTVIIQSRYLSATQKKEIQDWITKKKAQEAARLYGFRKETELMHVITSNNSFQMSHREHLQKITNLIQAGANPYQPDASGTAAYDLAQGDTEILAILATTNHKPATVSQRIPQQKLTHTALLQEVVRVDHRKQTVSQAYLTEFNPPLRQHTNVHNIHLTVEKQVLPLDILLTREMFYTLPQNPSDTHGKYHVFYHAHEAQNRVLQDFMTHLLTFETQTEHPHFIPLRFWHTAQIEKTEVRYYLDSSGLLEKRTNDNDLNINKDLLAVNISLFGNLKTHGESTLAYYLANRSISKVTTHHTIQPIFSFYDFDTQYLTQLCEVMKESYMENRGSILQICIPRPLVDHTVYLARAYGYPYKYNLNVGGFTTITTASTKEYSLQTHITPILDALQDGSLLQKLRDKRPENIKETMSEFQARIILGKDIMLNPQSGVKIFRIDNLPASKRAWYHQQIKKIANATFIDWLERVRDNKISDAVLTRIKDTPLGKLIQGRDITKINTLITQLQEQPTSAYAKATADRPHSRL